jgi:hypothetical protein
MHIRKIKKNVAGIWQSLKWHQIKKGDLIRIYDRGMRIADGGTVEFEATSDAYEVEIDGKNYWQFDYDLDRTIDCESTKDIHQG